MGFLGINKKKTLDYLLRYAPIATSTNNSELSSDGKVNDNNETSKEKKGETLQTAAGKDQYRRGIALYGSILLEVLGNKDSDNSETSPNKLTEEVQGSHYLNLAFVLFWMGRYGVPFGLGAPPLKHNNSLKTFLESVCFRFLINYVYLQCPSGLLYRRHPRWLSVP